MISVDKVRELAGRGLSAREIANELGVSRQRIYRFAHDNGISLPRAFRPVGASSRTVPRVVTGGVVSPINARLAGTISELLVAADLLARGWEAYLPIARCRGHDLIAVKGDRIVTIEVRSGRYLASGKMVYSKTTRRHASQHFAIVLTGEPVRYDPDLA